MKRVISTLFVLACFSGSSTIAAAAVPGPLVTVVAGPADGGEAVVARTDAQGAIHLVFSSHKVPHYAKSTDGGKTWSHAVAIVDHESQKPGLEYDVWDMAVGKGGRVHVALGTNAWKLKLPQSEWGYFYASLGPGDKHFSKVRNINNKPSEGFSLAIGDFGQVAAVWMADKLYANISSDGGSTFGPTVEIDPAVNPCNCCTTSSVYAADGRLAVLYREETNNERDMYLALWDLTQNKVTKTKVSTTPWKIDSCPMTYYSIVRIDDGFVAAWPTKGEIYFARLNADGTPRAPKEVKTSGASGMRSGVLALPMANGRTVVAWKKDEQLGWQIYDDRGRASGSPGSVKSAGSGATGVLGKNGDVVLFR